MFRRKNRDLQAFYESLSPSRVGLLGYTKKDRFRDFRKVFSTPEGRRVLAQIIAEAEGKPIVEADTEKPNVLAFRAGSRFLGHWIVKQLNAEPLEGDQT